MKENKHVKKVKDYFNRESSQFDAYYDESVPLKSIIRRISRKLSKGAIFGRLQAVLDLCKPVDNKTILEVGCGGGQYSIALAQRGADVLGIDFAENMIAIAKKRVKNKKFLGRCSFKVADVFSFSPKQKYDVVFATGVIDYMHRDQHVELVKKMLELSRGCIIISFPKLFHYHAFVRKIWLGLKGVPVCFFTKKQIHQLLENTNCKEECEIDVGILRVLRIRGRKS